MEEMGDSKQSLPVKVYSYDRCLRKGICAKSFEDLKDKCKDKFVTGETLLRIVTENDGFEIDDDYFCTLEGNTQLMILKEGELWTPSYNVAAPTASTSEEGQLNVEQVLGAFGKLKKKTMGKCAASKTSMYVPNSVKITPGLRNFCYQQQRYVQVRSKKKYPLPTGSIIFKTTADYETVLTKMKEMYFPMGRGILGRLSSYHCTLGSSKGEPVNGDNFSPHSFVTECQTLVPRLYLMTKEKIPHVLAYTDSSSEEISDNSGAERMDYESPNTSPRARQPFNFSSQMTGVKFNSTQDSVQQTQSRHFNVYAGTSSVGPSQQLSDQISPQPNRQGQLTPMAAASSNSINVHAGTPSVGPSQQLPDQISPQPNRQGQLTPMAAAPSNLMNVHAGTPSVMMSVDKRCPICCDRERDAVIVPCIHALCLVCALQIESLGQNCPQCRGPIGEVRSMFF